MLPVGIFSRKPNSNGIRASKAGKVLDEAKRDVKRPKDEVAQKRQQKQGGKR